MRNLPIKLIKKRDNDTSLNLRSGGAPDGGKNRLQGEALKERSNYFRRYLHGLKDKISQKTSANSYLPAIFKVKLNENLAAKSYRQYIGNIFNSSKKINLIGLINENQLLIKIDNISDLSAIENKFADIERNALGISAIEEAEDFLPILDVDEYFDGDLKVKLINYGDFKLNEIAEMNFKILCEKIGAKYQRLNYAKNLILYRVSGIKPFGLTNFNESDSIFSITKVPIYSLEKQSFLADESVEIKNPIPGVDYFKIGVFDEGISNIPHLKMWKSDSYVAFDKSEYDQSHGTFVAGIINYGDELQGENWTGTKPFKITEAVILPNSSYYIDETMMVKFMREAIIKNPEVKVWNFSIGNNTSIVDSQYSDFATFLDEIQDEHNVLIVKAAGNCSNFAKAAPRGRITQASESIRTLVVGSIAHDKNVHDLSFYNHPSPFSMVGPGISDVIKPDLVHYGGNAGVADGKVCINGVKSFTADGRVGKSVGTSFSTPRVAALAAELAGSLIDEFNPLLIKGLLVHSSSHPKEFEDVFENRLTQIGFGLPTKIGDILFNDPNEVTLILTDSVEKGSHIKIMDFPFPSSLVENGHFYGQIKITLVTAPDIDPSQGAEYIQSDVDVLLGTYDKKVAVIDNKFNPNPIDIDDFTNLLLPSLYSSRKQKAASASFKAERFLKGYNIGHSKQFIPLKKWCIDLEELQESHIKYSLQKDRNWSLKIEPAFRNNYDMRIQDSKNTSQEFALIITIKDTKGKGKVYDEVTNLLSQYNFIHENIRVDERIVVK